MKIIDSNDININEISNKKLIIFPECLKFENMMETDKIMIKLIQPKIKLIFTSNESLDIVNHYDLVYNGTMTLKFEFKSIKSQLSVSKFNNLLENIRKSNEGQTINLYFSSNITKDYDFSNINYLNVNKLKIDDILYCFSQFDFDKTFLNNTNFSSIIFKNIKINSNLQVQNLFNFLSRQKNLNNLKIENLNLELLDSEEQKLLNYFKVINNEIYMIRKNKNEETLLNINNFTLKNAPLIILNNNEKLIDNENNILINQPSILAINYCGIVKYEYNDKTYSLSIDQDYFEEDNMDVENTKNLNTFETFKQLIENPNFKISKLKLINFTKTFEIGNKELIKEVYFDNCSSEVTQNIIKKLPNLQNLKLKGINDLNCVVIPESIIRLTINDSYINNSSLPNLRKINITLNCLEDYKTLYNQNAQYETTIESIKNILKEENNTLNEIILEGNAIFLPFEFNDESCINKASITCKNCEINKIFFDKLNLNRQFTFINCSFEKDEEFLNSFKDIKLDFYTFNQLIFKQSEKNDVEDFIKNLFFKDDKNMNKKFELIQKRMNAFYGNRKINIITKSFEEHRQCVIIFYIFHNPNVFSSSQDLLGKFIEKFDKNIVYSKEEGSIENNTYMKIPIIWSDYYLSKEQINFIEGLNNITIELKKK